MKQTIIKHFCDLCGKETTNGMDRVYEHDRNDKSLCLPTESYWVPGYPFNNQRYSVNYVEDICEECLNAITEVVMTRQGKTFHFGPTAEEIAKMEANKEADVVLDLSK